jgi:anaerobic magnesium-protoporphyrin IX monomethyl ester cyclase
MAFKVLFIYSNPRKMSLVPTSIALFSKLLKSVGVSLELFDTTLYDNQDGSADPDKLEEKDLLVKPFSDNLNQYKDRIIYKRTNPHEDLGRTISRFHPDLLAITAVESTFLESINLLKSIRHHKIPSIVGGVFATFAPDAAISYPEVDMICVGEGEGALLELVRKMRAGEDYSSVQNLWVKKKDGSIVKNPIAPPVNLDDNPLIDIEIFETSRFYRAMDGKIYKMFPVETHRGCVYRCGFCNSPLQNKMYKENTGKKYFRQKSISKVKEEIEYFKKLGAEYLFLWADNFFAYPKKMIDEFCEMYSDIGLPFYCQSHPENLSVEKIEKLKAVGMQRIGIGIEHGNEKFRREIVKRDYSNEMLIERLKILTDLEVQYSVNNIIGFPGETPELVMDTVELNRRHTASDISCSIFTPFQGTELRKMALDLGYLKNPDILAHTNSESSILEMPQFPPDKILGKRRTFNMYVKFPKERWKDIMLAEEMTPEGDAAWQRLKTEYIATFIE